MSPDGHSSLVYAAADRKHRPASHPLLRGSQPVLERRRLRIVDLAADIRARRMALGLSQRGLAVVIGVTREAVSQWEAAQTYPSDDHMERLTELLGDLR